MKHAGLFAFGLTTCVLVPTALHVLRAGPEQVAKLVAPPTSELVINGAEVSIAADKAILAPGQKLHVTVTAKAETRTKVRVALLAYESTGTGGGRVETPPNRIGRGEVVLDVKHGQATQTFAFTLPGTPEQTMEGAGGFTHYRVLAMTPEQADEFDRARRRADRVTEPMGGNAEPLYSFNDLYRTAGLYEDDEDGGHGNVPHTVGRLDVVTPARDSALAITVPAHAKAGDDIEVVVKVRNHGKADVVGLNLSLTAEKHWGVVGEWQGLSADDVAIEDADRKLDIGKGKTATATFHVKASEAGTLGLFATTSCDDATCYESGALSSAVALDAIDIAGSDHPPQVVDL